MTPELNEIDTANKIYSYDEGAYVENNVEYRAGFDRKQNRYVAAIKNNSTIHFPAEGNASLSGLIVECDTSNGLAHKVKKFIYGGELSK